MKKRIIALVAVVVLAAPFYAMAQYGSGGSYGSGGGYGSGGDTGSGGDSGRGGGYGSGGDRFAGKVNNRFDVDYEVAAAYYDGWEAPENSSIEGRMALSGAMGELSPTYTPWELWYEWTAPQAQAAARGARMTQETPAAVSFSTRGSTTAKDYGCDTTLEVWMSIDPAEYVGTGAYGEYWDEEAEEYKPVPLTADNLSDFDQFYTADGSYAVKWFVGDTEQWFLSVAVDYDEEYDIYELGSLTTFYPDPGATYLVHIWVYNPGEVRLAWHMDGTEADVATPVYRFYSKNYKGHFYTADPDEKQSLIDTNPNWKYEGEAYSANPDGGGVLTPLYRFYSKAYRGHFFTIDQEERDNVIENNPNWKFEGIAYYVQEEPGEGTVPVYRFWSKEYRHHFYTMNQAEKEDLEAHNPKWKYEKIAFYAIP